jgi:hypothetical protein
MPNLHTAKRLSFKELVEAHAVFHMGKAYVATYGSLGVKLFREFEKRGKRWYFCGEGRASKDNYGHFMPVSELTE